MKKTLIFDNPILLIITLLIFFYMMMIFWTKRKPKELWNSPDLRIVIVCEQCGTRHQYPYRLREHYVGAKLLKLCKCGGIRIVERIYNVVPIENEKKERYENLFR